MWSFIKKTFTFVTLAIVLIGISILMSFISKKGTDFGEPLKCDLARSFEASYHVSITYYGYYECSGTLITRQHVLTVAHCVFDSIEGDKYKTKMMVFVDTRRIHFGTPYDVKNITCHGSYELETLKDDVAVVQLTNEVTIPLPEITIPLPDNGIIPYKGLKLIVSGYDQLGKDMTSNTGDQHIFSMQVVSSDLCRKLYRGRDMFGKFCALADPGYSTCLGDDGSPATVNKKYVIGMSIDCFRYDTKKKPELFIDVSSYITFIKSATV